MRVLPNQALVLPGLDLSFFMGILSLHLTESEICSLKYCYIVT